MLTLYEHCTRIIQQIIVIKLVGNQSRFMPAALQISDVRATCSYSPTGSLSSFTSAIAVSPRIYYLTMRSISAIKTPPDGKSCGVVLRID